MINIPPSNLRDTLLLANQFSPVPSPLGAVQPMPAHRDSALDFVIDASTLASLLKESEEELRSMSTALMV